MPDLSSSPPNRVQSRPGRWLYALPVVLLVGSAWTFRSGQAESVSDRYAAQAAPSGPALGFEADQAGTDQTDPRRFRIIDDRFVEDAATGIRLPVVAGLSPSEVFAQAAKDGAAPLGFNDAELDPAATDTLQRQGSSGQEAENTRTNSGVVRPLSPPGDLRYGIGPRPSSLAVTAIGVTSGVTPIGVDASRALQVPRRADIVGWWSGGSVPGESGPTVLVGHYDSRVTAGVFARLKEMSSGDFIVVSQTDGALYTYYVTEVQQLSKSAFPTKRVYGRTRHSTLRLVTCGGKFDRKTGHYVENTIVYAELWSYVPSPWPNSTTTPPASTTSTRPFTTTAPTTSTTTLLAPTTLDTEKLRPGTTIPSVAPAVSTSAAPARSIRTTSSIPGSTTALSIDPPTTVPPTVQSTTVSSTPDSTILAQPVQSEASSPRH